MFCPRCGYRNADNTTYCIQCGSPIFLEQSAPQDIPPPQAAPPRPFYAPPEQSYTPQPSYYDAPPPKANRGLIIGLICGCGTLLAAVIVLAVLLITGNGAAQGQWYNEALAMVLDFGSNGKLTCTSSAGEVSADYTYDKESGKGTISGDITGEGTSLYFELLDDQLVLYDEDSNQPYSWFYKSWVKLDAKAFVKYPYYEYYDDHTSSGIIGTWYATDGYSGTIDIRADDTFTASALGQSYSGVYTFNGSSGTFSYPDYGIDLNFSVSGGTINCNGVNYTRNYVYQMSLDEFISQFGEETFQEHIIGN